MSKTTIVRFAPSPTGRLHIGNVRTALLNWLFARKAGGQFLLRLDDTDRTRSTEEFAKAIRDDLAWLGLDWDDEFRQSNREARYAETADRLKASGRLYPCYESEDELDRKRKRQMARGLPPLYDRAALRLSLADRTKLEAEGRKPHWRFRLANAGPGADPASPEADIMPTRVEWEDLVRGSQHVDAGSLSDPVLVRADGTYLYTFTSVVDDIDRAITHVVRGEDHVTNTGVQIQIFEALGATPPAFAHFSLLVGKDGEALSKRLGSLSVAGFREAGLEPMAVNSLAALIGTSDAVEPRLSLAELAASFDFAKLSRSPSRFDVTELDAINARLLHMTPYGQVADRLAELVGADAEQFWLAVRGNIRRFADVHGWRQVILGQITPVIEDAPYLAAASAVLPTEPWSDATWTQWTDAIKSATGRKGRQLFHPLRLALTARENGPEMKLMLPLMTRGRVAARLRGEIA